MPHLSLSSYSSLVSLTAPFTPPPSPPGPAAAAALDSSISYLWNERHNFSPHHALPSLESHQKPRLFRQLLTVRDPSSPPLPASIRNDVETVTRYISSKKPLTPVFSIPTISPQCKISLWKGDITTLTGITAMVNAANGRLLGCFTPDHNCIDNVIHGAAGPRLREDCKRIMDAQGSLEPNGMVKVTRGYLLHAKYVLHTVGPQISPQQTGATEDECRELQACYRSCLEVLEQLPGEGKSVAFCCVGAGVFGFPAREAAGIAVDTVREYLAAHPNSTVTHVIFNVFTPRDLDLYHAKLSSSISLFTIPSVPTIPPPQISLATSWLRGTQRLLITAGAGLSASDGLDYTSRALFKTHFPGMWRRGFTCLYDLFGHTFDSPETKWGYYFSHLLFVREWEQPERSVYRKLRMLARYVERKGGEWFVRTSNADCLFVRNGFAAERVSTPQGSYTLLQCLDKCRADAVFGADEFVEKALPYLDREECVLRVEEGWEQAVPKCRWCGGDMFLCVRGGDYFNDGPFVEGEKSYRRFVEEALKGEGEVVVLELGVGFNTPGVVRRVDEALVERGRGRVKMVRVGLKGSEWVDWVREGVDMVGVEGDAGVVVGELLKGLEVGELL